MHRDLKEGRAWHGSAPWGLALTIVCAFALIVAPGAFAGNQTNAPDVFVTSHQEGSLTLLGGGSNVDAVLPWCDQYAGTPGTANTSQDFTDPGDDPFDTHIADDCDVPAIGSTTVGGIKVDGAFSAGGGPIAGVNVRFHSNTVDLPVDPPFSDNTDEFTYYNAGGDLEVDISPDVVLPAGTKVWIEVQVEMAFSCCGQWFWASRTGPFGFSAAFKNPGGGFGTPCTPGWGRKLTCLGGTVPDQGYLLYDAAGPPPSPVANDHLASATVFPAVPAYPGSVSVSGTTVGATAETDAGRPAVPPRVGEPDHAAASKPLASVWYRFIPTTTDIYTFRTCTGTTIDTTLAVYTGTRIQDLTEVVSNDDGCGAQSAVTFYGTAGTTYHIAVDTFSTATGTFTLTASRRNPARPRRCRTTC